MNKKIWSMLAVSTMILAGCNAGSASSAKSSSVKTKTVADGTYEGKGESYGVEGEMSLKVTFKDNKITSIETVNAGSTESIYQTVEQKLYPRIIENQSVAVDNITGATVSSAAAKGIIKNIIDENGGDAKEWQTEVAKSTEIVKKEGYDVVVVGLGASGIASYLSAANAGATVFGMDSAAKIGGNGAMTAGPMAVNPVRQVELNNGQQFVDEEVLVQDWLAYTEGDAKEEMIRKFVEESGETLGWLEDNYDFKFGDKMFTFFDPNQWALWTMYTDKGGTDKDTAYINSMEKAKGLNQNNDYMTELTAKEFITDADGKVTGVRAVSYDGTTYEISAKSVILATGGYIGNAEMSKEFTGYVWHTHAMTQCNGAGITMAQSIGGALYNPDVAVEDHIAQLSNIIRSDDVNADDKAILTSLLLDTNAVMVDSKGESFNERAGMNLAFNAWEAGSEFYTIYSADEIDRIKMNGMATFNKPTFLAQGGTYEPNTPVSNIEDILAIGEEYNTVVSADSLKELSEKLGIQLAIKDVHGKADGKFYAIKGAAYIYSSTGGVDVDTNFNLLTKDRKAVENVYVVGNDSMGVLFASDKAYVTYGGAAQGYALTSGRVAGENAAKSAE